MDTNVVSVLFNQNDSPLRPSCLEAVAGRQLVISFMTRAELLLWPAVNNWGKARCEALTAHLELYTTLYADPGTCALWAATVSQRRKMGRPIQTADAWIAAAALQWSLPLVTADFGDYAQIAGLEIVPIA